MFDTSALLIPLYFSGDQRFFKSQYLLQSPVVTGNGEVFVQQQQPLGLDVMAAVEEEHHLLDTNSFTQGCTNVSDIITI